MTDLLDRLKTVLANRCTIERELGSGGMATVYLAEDVKHHRKVAVKVLAAGAGCGTRLRAVSPRDQDCRQSQSSTHTAAT